MRSHKRERNGCCELENLHQEWPDFVDQYTINTDGHANAIKPRIIEYSDNICPFSSAINTLKKSTSFLMILSFLVHSCHQNCCGKPAIYKVASGLTDFNKHNFNARVVHFEKGCLTPKKNGS
jgi:hypothetical protein